MDERHELVPDQIAKVIQETIFWFEERTEALKDIVESEFLVVLEGKGGSKTELDEDESRVFRAGIQTALSLIGKFPLSLDRPVTSAGVDEVIGK